MWLNVGLALVLAVALALLLGCAAGPVTGPSTLRCEHGAAVIHYAPDYQKITCDGALTMTGSLSDNGAAVATGIVGLVSGWLLRP